MQPFVKIFMLAPVRERQAVTAPPATPSLMRSANTARITNQTRLEAPNGGTASDLLYTLAFYVAYFLEQH